MRRQRPERQLELPRPSQPVLKHNTDLCSQLSALFHQIAIPLGAWSRRPLLDIPHPDNRHSVFHQIPWLPGTVGDALQYQLAQTGFSAQILDKVCGPLGTGRIPKICHEGMRGSWFIVSRWECLWRSQFRNKRNYPLASPIWTLRWTREQWFIVGGYLVCLKDWDILLAVRTEIRPW